MRRALALLVLLVALPSCSTVKDFTEKAKLPRDDAAGVAAAITAGLATPDLDGDGTVNGLDEWRAFVRITIRTYRADKR